MTTNTILKKPTLRQLAYSSRAGTLFDIYDDTTTLVMENALYEDIILSSYADTPVIMWDSNIVGTIDVVLDL